jgi:hypothetical protein
VDGKPSTAAAGNDHARTNGGGPCRFEWRLFMNAMKLWIANVIALLAVAAAAGDEAALESLDPATALGDVRVSRGVVFVDLYADW